MVTYHPDDMVVWSDGTHCQVSDLDEMSWMSDDYVIIGEHEHVCDRPHIGWPVELSCPGCLSDHIYNINDPE